MYAELARVAGEVRPYPPRQSWLRSPSCFVGRAALDRHDREALSRAYVPFAARAPSLSLRRCGKDTAERLYIRRDGKAIKETGPIESEVSIGRAQFRRIKHLFIFIAASYSLSSPRQPVIFGLSSAGSSGRPGILSESSSVLKNARCLLCRVYV